MKDEKNYYAETFNNCAKMGSRKFNFPFTPYPIQTDLMNAIFECIEEGKIGIFESPTGSNPTNIKGQLINLNQALESL
jgi:hypothetical protein